MNNNIQNQQKKRESSEGGGEKYSSSKQQGGKESQSTKQQLPTIPSSPPSSNTSPSHEFSFTISLHSSSTVPEKTKTTTPPSFAIDLSPADDIFFHGHLLPLHLLSHLPISPRSSTNSLDSFTLPIKELMDDDQKPTTTTNTNTNTNTTTTTTNTNYDNYSRENKGRIKAKSFSFLKFPRWRKGSEIGEREKEMDKEEEDRKKKVGSISQILRRYAKMIGPLLFNKGGRKETGNLHRQPYSFSGNLGLKGNNKQDLRGRRGEFSAPASLWTSPTNSGVLLTTPTGIHSSSSESSMEELQSAIQAAIAHCKNSIAIKEEKLQC